MTQPIADARPLTVGDERIVEVGPIAHGGHFIAHSDGRTLFVRHAMTGERVRVRVTEVNRRIVRADAVELLEASPARVDAPCEWARAGGCGGCDFQAIALDEQRRLKTQVLAESLQRFAGIADAAERFDLDVRALPGSSDGLHWRTRMRWAVTAEGTLGLRRHRSHALVDVGTCLLAAPGTDAHDLASVVPAGASEVVAALGSDGKVSIAADGRHIGGPSTVRQSVGVREWRVRPTSFWQVHPALAEALGAEVMRQATPEAGGAWWDLYSGAGLFASALAEGVGVTGRIDAVETAHDAVREARRALHDLPWVRLHGADVPTWLRADDRPTPDGVVLDPPRAGAGAAVVAALADHRVPTVVYVACDPVALARDVALFAARGYTLDRVVAFDAFPMTHHVESVARLRLVEFH